MASKNHEFKILVRFTIFAKSLGQKKKTLNKTLLLDYYWQNKMLNAWSTYTINYYTNKN